MDFTESAMKSPTTPFSINDILTSNNQQHISRKLKQFCRFRRSSLDCFIVSKDDKHKSSAMMTSGMKSADERAYMHLYSNNNNNPVDMRCRHGDMTVSGNWLSVDISDCVRMSINLMTF